MVGPGAWIGERVARWGTADRAGSPACRSPPFGVELDNLTVVAVSAADKAPQQKRGNRLSSLQRDILSFVTNKGQPIGDRISHLPRTGDVVDAVGRRRDNAGFASVSRALARLEKAGLVAGYRPSVRTVGNGCHWGALPQLKGDQR